MTPTQGCIVLLTIISGEERISQPAFVLSASPGPEGQPPVLNLAFLHPGRLDAIGTPDWRNSLDRATGVKHQTHDDVKNQAEGRYYNECLLAVLQGEPVESASGALESVENSGEQKTDAQIEGDAANTIKEAIQEPTDKAPGVDDIEPDPQDETVHEVTSGAQSGDAPQEATASGASTTA